MPSTAEYVLEFGMGVDLHGEDATKAASRAVFDALRHSSLPLLREIRERGGEMVVDVTVAVPGADQRGLEEGPCGRRRRSLPARFGRPVGTRRRQAVVLRVALLEGVLGRRQGRRR